MPDPGMLSLDPEALVCHLGDSSFNPRFGAQHKPPGSIVSIVYAFILPLLPRTLSIIGGGDVGSRTGKTGYALHNSMQFDVIRGLIRVQ